MSDFWHRGFSGSVTVRRFGDQWLVQTDIFTPTELADRMGDPISVPDKPFPEQSINSVRAQATDQAMRIIDEFIARGNASE